MPKYKAAAYIRLSYTDDHSSESDSISNQRKLIENFVERNRILRSFPKRSTMDTAASSLTALHSRK